MKKLDLSPDGSLSAAGSVPTLKVRDGRTGRSVVVRGVGALAKNDLKLRKGVSLLKPIAEQALARTGQPKAG